MKIVLSNAIDVISGGTPNTSNAEYWNGGIGWLSVADFNNGDKKVYKSEKTISELGLKNSSTNMLNTGDIIISARGTVGALAQLGSNMCSNQSCFGLRGKKNIIKNDYLYYALKNYIKNIQTKTQGSVFATINIDTFKLIEINIEDDLCKQQKIADVLSALDDKIELNNKINAKLEATAKDLYNYWFVQFDFPDGNGRPYKSSGGKMVYTPILKREIPDGWTVENFNNYVNIACGFSFNSSSYKSDGFWKIVTIKNVKDSDLDLSNVETITNIPQKMPDYAKLEVGDILISLTGNVGRMCFVDSENLLLNQRVGKIIAKDRFSVFSYLFLSSAENRQRLEQISNGSSQKNLSPIQAVDFLFAVPDERVLEKFDEYSEYIYKTIISNRKQSRLLQKIRDFLLPMLMNGQISVD